jgi:hypothetical protein
MKLDIKKVQGNQLNHLMEKWLLKVILRMQWGIKNNMDMGLQSQKE